MGKSITDLSSVTTQWPGSGPSTSFKARFHGVDASGALWSPRLIRRNKLLEFFASPAPCLVGLEASGSAHHLGARADHARP